MVPMWRAYIQEVRAVIQAADAVDRATPEMAVAGVDALRTGAQDAAGLAQKVWLAMAGLRSGGKS